MPDQRQLFCLQCEQPTIPKTRHMGSFAGELFLYLIFIFISLFSTWLLMLAPAAYSVMRIVSATRGCENCGSTNLIPLDSPKAQRMMSNAQK